MKGVMDIVSDELSLGDPLGVTLSDGDGVVDTDAVVDLVDDVVGVSVADVVGVYDVDSDCERVVCDTENEADDVRDVEAVLDGVTDDVQFTDTVDDGDGDTVARRVGDGVGLSDSPTST